MLKIYGKQRSRAVRCLWVLEEMGIPYQQIPLNTQNGETRTPEFLALNPAGKVPVLDDEGFVLRESLAINWYLVTKAATPLWPDDRKIQALINQWSSWAISELEVPLNAIFQERKIAEEKAADADAAFIADKLSLADKALNLLDGALAAETFVGGAAFTLGDINACSTVMMGSMFCDIAAYPAVQNWLGRCLARPAWKAVTLTV